MLNDQLAMFTDPGPSFRVSPFRPGSLDYSIGFDERRFSSLGPTQVRQRLSVGMNFMTSLSALGSSLGHAVPYVAPLLAGLHLAGHIKPLKELLSYLEDSTGWKWYRLHGTETGLGANAMLTDVLLRLHRTSMPGKPERDFLVNELLPGALLADLFNALGDSDPPRVWSKTANVVFFLDGFEALQHASSSTATRLLQVLTTKQRREGTTDPVLLVVGGREYLPGSRRGVPEPYRRTTIQSELEVQRSVQTRYAHLQQRLPVDRHFLRLNDLY